MRISQDFIDVNVHMISTVFNAHVSCIYMFVFSNFLCKS